MARSSRAASRSCARAAAPAQPRARAFEADEGDQWLLIHKRDEAAQRRLGRGGSPAERQDRAHERRRQGRSRRPLERPGAGGQRGDRPRRRRRGSDAPVDRPDARHPRYQALQRPRLALRDQVGRFPRAGGRRRRQGPDLDAKPQRRGDLLPEAPRAADLDRRPPGDRRRRGRGARRRRPARLLPAPDASSAGSRPPDSCTRPSICSISTDARSSVSRWRTASACCGAS